MNRQKAIDSLIKEKGLKPIPYQIDFLKKENFTKPFVLGAGTSSGKTFTAAMWLELFYSIPSNKGLKTLLIPASTIVLRDNMADSFEWFNPNFTYCVCKSKAELDAAMKGSCDVIIVLPQTAIKLVSSLKHFHNFVLDEAHQWYFKTTITSIIKKIKPKNQLLLTGTPSRFIANGDKFDFFFVPVMELYNLGLVSNVKIEVVSSIYNPSYSDYSSAYGSLKTSYNLKQKENEDSLKMVCEEMVKRLKNPSITKDKHLMNRLLSNPLSVFGEIDKTIIFCHSQKQANQFHKTLSKIKELKDSVLISHSDIDKDSIMFNEFKTDNTKKILIAVDRGKLGFSMGELFNIVDFTLTQNLDMLLQMYGRLLRLSEKNPDKQKIYYKVATKNTSGYFVDLMTAMMCLTSEEYYSKYNGKNMGGIRIPKVLLNKTKSKSIINKTNKSKSVKPYVSMEQLGIPIDLNFFKNVSLYKQNDKFGTVAECTLSEVRSMFFNIKLVQVEKCINVISYEECKKILKDNKITSSKEYRIFYKENKHLNIPKWPEGAYKENWKSWGDFLETGRISDNEKFKYRLSFDECKNFLKSLGLKNIDDYKKLRNLSQENKLKFPANPSQIYKNEWVSWGDFLGTNRIANQNKVYLSLDKAKEFLKDKNFNIHSWREYTKSKDFPEFLPKDVYCVYGKDKNWKGLRDLFGTENKWNGVYKVN